MARKKTSTSNSLPRFSTLQVREDLKELIDAAVGFSGVSVRDYIDRILRPAVLADLKAAKQDLDRMLQQSKSPKDT